MDLIFIILYSTEYKYQLKLGLKKRLKYRIIKVGFNKILNLALKYYNQK